MDRLRQETRVDHRSVEAAFPLMASNLRVDQYIACLQQLHGLVAEWERHAIESTSSRLRPLLEQRQRRSLLERDLAWFGVPADPLDHPSLPPMEGEATLLGAAYVMEGSRLGGQFIARHLEHVLGLTPGSGNAYFRGQGEQTSLLWREFCTALQTHIPDHETDTVIRSAKVMFQIFGAWMMRPRAEPRSSIAPQRNSPPGLAKT